MTPLTEQQMNDLLSNMDPHDAVKSNLIRLAKHILVAAQVREDFPGSGYAVLESLQYMEEAAAEDFNKREAQANKRDAFVRMVFQTPKTQEAA